MKRFFLVLTLLCASVFLAGCAGGNSFDQNLRKVEGKPINDVAIMLKGKHTGEYQDGNATVYVWQKRQTESVFGSTVTDKGYRLGSASTAMGNAEFLWTGIQYHSCVIRARTMDGIVQRITMEGDPGGCESIYGNRRKTWTKQEANRGLH